MYIETHGFGILGHGLSSCILALGCEWNINRHSLIHTVQLGQDNHHIVWRGRPLVTRETVVNLIGSTTTKDLRIKSALDLNKYETGKKSRKKNS